MNTKLILAIGIGVAVGWFVADQRAKGRFKVDYKPMFPDAQTPILKPESAPSISRLHDQLGYLSAPF